MASAEAYIQTSSTRPAMMGCQRRPPNHDDRRCREIKLYMSPIQYAEPATSVETDHRKSSGLSRDEEVSFSQHIRIASLMRKQQEVSQSQQHTDLSLEGIIQRGQSAREALVTANIGLVVSLAQRYYFGACVGTILTLQDLIQEGQLGLMEAAERFEPEKGFRFSTYAVWWIRHRILRSINNTSRIIRIPVHMQSTLQKIKTTRKCLSVELGRDPTIEEIAGRLEMSADKVQQSLAHRLHVVSLELPLFGISAQGDLRTLGEILASDAPSPEDDVHAEFLKRDVREVINELADTERAVIMWRFGLEDGDPRSREETSKILGISRDRVRLIEARALNKLRSPQRNYRLKDYVAAASASRGGRSKIESRTKEDDQRRLWLV